jgi:MFS family permease
MIPRTPGLSRTDRAHRVGLTRLLGFLLVAITALAAGFNGMQGILIPGQVASLDPANKVTSLALLTMFAAVGSMIGIPLGGALSDKTASRFGKRSPWIFGLSIISAALIIAMGLSGNLVMLGTVYTMLWLTLNMHQGAVAAILPDRIPEQRRGVASAVMGLGTPIGVLVGVNVASHVSLRWGYAFLALFLVVGSVALVIGAPEAPSLDVSRSAELSTRHGISRFFEAFRERDFTLAFISRFMLFLSYFTVGGYLYYTLSDYIGIKNIPEGNVPVAVSTLLSITVIVWVFVATFCGWLADKLDRRKLFVGVSAVGLAASMMIPIVSPTWSGMIVYSVSIGAFIGTYYAVDLAVMSLVLPSAESAGRDLGILSVATGLPQIMSSVVAGALINYLGGYTTLYLFGGFCALVSGVVVLFIKKVR